MLETSKKNRQLITALCVLVVLFAILSKQASSTRSDGVAKFHDDNASSISIDSTFAGEANPKTEFIIINIGQSDNAPKVVSGWQIKSLYNKQVIGPASPLPLQGMLNEERPVVVTNKAEVIVSSGASPLGVSFRENKCTGLLGEFQSFSPPLAPACLDCAYRTLSGYPQYNVCVMSRKGDSDFFLNSWRMYLDSQSELWDNSLDVLRLYDQEDRLLSTTRY